MKLGFTGTQKGMTPQQQMAVELLLTRLMVAEAHHGDCVGADEQFHHAVLTRNACIRKPPIQLIGHPPLLQHRRAWCQFNIFMPPKPYLDRNHDIVDAIDALIVCPNTPVEQRRSGTWATFRYAKRMKKPMIVILPSGEAIFTPPQWWAQWTDRLL